MARAVDVGNGVTLEVLDWGGAGPALLLLAGLGNSAHIFDDLALAFIDRWHVLGLEPPGLWWLHRHRGGVRRTQSWD